MANMITICPNCQCRWAIEEIEDQQCDACGYPDEELMSDFNGDPDNEFDPDEIDERKVDNG